MIHLWMVENDNPWLIRFVQVYGVRCRCGFTRYLQLVWLPVITILTAREYVGASPFEQTCMCVNSSPSIFYILLYEIVINNDNRYITHVSIKYCSLKKTLNIFGMMAKLPSSTSVWWCQQSLVVSKVRIATMPILFTKMRLSWVKIPKIWWNKLFTSRKVMHIFTSWICYWGIVSCLGEINIY